MRLERVVIRLSQTSVLWSPADVGRARAPTGGSDARQLGLSSTFDAHTPEPRLPGNLLPALHDTLSALADIDVRCATECERLDKQTLSPEAKRRLLDDLTSRHKAAREPYVLQLEELQRRMARLLQHH